jgi:type II secretory pathway pseudopilin PulG
MDFHNMRTHHNLQAGFSFVEIIVVSAISAMIFGALFSSFQYTLALISDSRAKLSALSVANDRMEYFRSLPYDDVGTISGIPPGTIAQNGTSTRNGIEFAERVLVEYVDDPADGQDTATTSDSNSIPSDYKRIKVEYTWDIGNGTSSIALISNIVPRSVETTAGGGTARINVIDSNSMLLPGASVRLLNDTTTSTIDVTRLTDVSGAALFSGAPAGSNYEVSVTANIGGNQYSTTGTYQATTSNPNPSVAPFAVLEADVSTLTFQIGELSDLDISTYSALSEGSTLEEFTDLLTAASSTNVEVVSGDAVLENTAGVYQANGIVYTEIITPSPLYRWETVRVAADVPANTDYAVRFYTGTGTGPFSLIPDAELSGNSVGFADSLINISELEAVSYPSITAGITLETSNTAQTPAIDEIAVFYTQSQTPRASITYDITGTKTIGTNSSSSPIFKYDTSFTTDGAGEYELLDLEFDQYTIENQPGLDIASACPGYPLVHRAGVDSEIALTLVPDDSNTVRTQVVDALGRTIPGAEVTLSRPGYSQTLYSNVCGQVFFTGGVSAESDYTLDVSVAGYANQSLSPFDVNGDAFQSVMLSI